MPHKGTGKGKGNSKIRVKMCETQFHTWITSIPKDRVCGTKSYRTYIGTIGTVTQGERVLNGLPRLC